MRVAPFASFLLVGLFPVAAQATLFDLACSLPVFGQLLCPEEPKDCGGQPCWIETTGPSFWDWLVPPYPPRHVVCFAFDEATRKAYLVGGVFKNQRVNIYDPETREWTNGSAPPVLLHHTQCVPVDGKIYVVSAFTGTYMMSPYKHHEGAFVTRRTLRFFFSHFLITRIVIHSSKGGLFAEESAPDIYIYDISTDTWSTKAGLPEERRRGGSASVHYEGKIYVSHGGGHGDDPSVGWLDYYDIAADEWTTDLPDAPNPRDHTGGALVNGNLLCVAGGRNVADDSAVLPTDCYDLVNGVWSEEEDILQGRRGSAYGSTCDGNLIVSGGEGESTGQTWPNVEVFDGATLSWTRLDDLNRARFGHGMAIDCGCNQIYVAAGSASWFVDVLVSVETYFPNGVDEPCSAPP